jgi:Ion channel
VKISCGPGPNRLEKATRDRRLDPRRSPAELRRGVLCRGDDGSVHRIHYRFGLVLALLVVTIAFSLAAPEGDGARFIAVTLQAAVLVAAVIASKRSRLEIGLSALVALVGVTGTAAAIAGTDEFGDGSAAIVALFYVLLTPPVIVSGLIKQFREAGAVTLQTMFGVLCLYLLIGLMFAVAYGAIDEVSDTSFFTNGSTQRDDYLYFSFTTLSTVGYGDLTAATNLGRSLAITEALVGQLYLVTVVAVIVSNLGPAQRATERAD